MKNTRKILAIIMVVAMCFSMFSHTAFASATTIAEGTAGESVTWKLTDDGVLTISGTGAMNTDWYSPPWKEYNESITEVVVEEGITKISDSAFCYAENLVKVSIPATVTYVTSYTFDGCRMLEEINVTEENTAYKSIDGILFTEDEKTLVMYPANKNCDKYTIPSSVTTIGKFAFESNQGINTVIIPDTVTVMEKDVFTDSVISTIIVGNGIDTIPQTCFSFSNIDSVILSDSVKTINYAAFWSSRLETLIIGSGVESIDKDILAYTDELTAIHYKGTPEDWDAISIHEENEDLNSKELHFISEDDYRDGVTPTCVDGHTAGYYCETCEDYLTGEVIPATDDHEYDGVVTEPTCTEGGYTTYTCTVCDDWYIDDNTDPLGHEFGDDGLCEVCGEECIHIDEKVDGKCDFCGFTFDYEEVEADETNTVYIPEEYGEVVVKFTPTESGWYAVVSDNGGDDENNDPYVTVFDANGEEIEYDDDSDYEYTYNFYCEFEAEAGKTYYIVLSNYDGDVEYDYTIEKHVGIDHQPTPAEPYVTLTWDVEAEYQWFNLDDEMIAIDGETEATLKNPKIGSVYGCVVTYNGIEIYSDMLFYGYAITHQPTADEPYVELNDDTDATYQWYVAKEGKVELTDENTIPFPSEDEGPVYDTENGWSGIYTGSLEGMYDGYACFIVQLKKGDTIKIELFGDYYGYVEFTDMMTSGFYISEVDEDGNCEFTAKKDSFYSVTAYRDVDGDEVFVKAYIDGYEFTEIDGATSAEYAPTEDGLYACEVTFADDSTEMSKVFEKKTVPAGEDDNTGGNAGDNTGGNTGNDENTKPAPKPEIPNTDATVNNVNSNGWFAVMLTLSMGLALVMASNKKRIFSK